MFPSNWPCFITVFWYELSVNITDTYDYIWLVDDDLDTTFLDWNLMRLMLLILRPLVAQTGNPGCKTV